MKIAVPVDSDKVTIFKRTGQAPFFAIFQDGVFETTIANAHGKEGHNHHDHEHGHEHAEDDIEHLSHHKKDVAGLVGCDVILVQMVGEHMREAIESLNIKIKKIREKDGHIASEVVKNFLLKREEV
jgi:predicted Fe-Mo cluster-binding NifX family protein